MANNFESKFSTLKAFMKNDVVLRLGTDNKSAHSGEQAYNDIIRATFVINGTEISREVVEQLYEKHKSLYPNNNSENKDYRSFAKEIFKEMFIHTNTPIPNSSILEEMVTNCNQAGYESAYGLLSYELSKHTLTISSNGRKIYINCKNSNSVDFECSNHAMTIKDPMQEDPEVCDISFAVRFTLRSDEDKIRYRDGEMHLVFPKELKEYGENQTNKNLIDVIKEIFYELVEKFFGHCLVKEKDDMVEMTSKLKDGPLNSLWKKTHASSDNRFAARNGMAEATNKLKNNNLNSVLEDIQPLNNNRSIER